MLITRLLTAIVLALFVTDGFAQREAPRNASPLSRFTLWQLPNQTRSQIMSYVLQTGAGRIVVIDGGTTGDAPYLKGFLAAKGNEVEAWIITHAHDDHFGALIPILSQPDGPRIKTIYGSLPSLDWIKQNGHGKEDVEPYAEFLQALDKAGQKMNRFELGQDFKIDGIRFEVLGIDNPEITANAINNSSLVLRVSDDAKSVLFLADLGVEGGQKLLKSPLAKRLPTDYVQMAHHGQQGVDEQFYRAIGAKYCLWPTPKWLWDNDSGKGKGSGPWKTLETRAWMEKLPIKRHFVMADGLVEIK